MGIKRLLFAARVAALTAVFVFAAYAAGGERRRGFSRELTPLEPASIEESAVWDLSGCATVDERARAYGRFVRPVYFEDVAGRCRAYLSRGDSLFYRGYNIGRHERMLMADMLPVAVRGVEVESAFADSICGEGLLFDVPTAERGLHRARVAREGMLIAWGDTLRGVRLVREDFDVHKSIAGDSAAVRERAVLFRWLRQGDVLPLAVELAEYEADGALRSARLFVPDFALIDAGDDIARDSDGSAVAPAVEDCMRVVSALGVSVGPDGVDLSFPPSGLSFAVDIHLLDLAGNVYSGTRLELSAESETRLTLPRGGAARGRYVLAVSPEPYPDESYKIFVEL